MLDRNKLAEALNRLSLNFNGVEYIETPAAPIVLMITAIFGSVISQLPIYNGKIYCGEYVEDIEIICQAYRNLSKTGTIEGIELKDWK